MPGSEHEAELVRLNNEGYAAFEAGDWPAAGQLLAQAAPLATGKQAAVLWFDAALAAKFVRDWDNAYSYGKEAASRVPNGTENPAFWNLGIAATAKRDWATARDCWAGYGLPVEPGDTAIEQDFGPTCVRIQTGNGEEVVWARRLCPARAKVISVPLDTSRRFGEVVLHDGAPNGERRVSWGTVPVFDEIELFEPSDVVTLAVQISAHTQEDVQALLELVGGAGWGIETPADFVLLCDCCSKGTVDQERTVEAGDQQIRIAAPEEIARQFLEQWQDDRRSWTDLRVG